MWEGWASTGGLLRGPVKLPSRWLRSQGIYFRKEGLWNQTKSWENLRVFLYVCVYVGVSWCLKAQAMESWCLGLNLGPQPSYHAKEEERDQGGIGEDHKGLGLQLKSERKA